MFAKSLFLSVALIPASTFAAFLSSTNKLAHLNKWDDACTNGACSYFSGDGHKKAYSSFVVHGAPGALSDITQAAGWQIKGCDANWSEGSQHVKIVCAGTVAQMARCAQLFEGGTARDTIVRLPPGCGQGPFARVVASADVTEGNRFWKGPQTHNVVLDYNFHQIKHDRGDVSFAVTSSNIESVGARPIPPGGLAEMKRDLEHNLMPRWEIGKTFNLPPIDIDKDFNLFHASIDCPNVSNGLGFSADVTVDGGVDIDAQVAFGFSLSGKIFPPKIDKMQLIGAVNGSAKADIMIDARATGKFDTGSIPIYTVGIPGLNIPGILNLGPSFSVNGQVSADVGIETKIKTGVNYDFPDIQMVFPKESGDSNANVLQTTTPLQLSVDPSVSAKGVITAAIIPRVDVGISILSGLAEATVYLDVEGKATLTLDVEAHAHVDVTIPTGKNTNKGSSKPKPKPKPLPKKLPAVPKKPAHHPRHNTPAPETHTTWGASGCACLEAGVDINAGVHGAIHPIFDKSYEWDIYSKEWNIFKKCFGAGDKAKTTKPKPKPKPKGGKKQRSIELTERSMDFTCPALSLPGLLEVLNL